MGGEVVDEGKGGLEKKCVLGGKGNTPTNVGPNDGGIKI